VAAIPASLPYVGKQGLVAPYFWTMYFFFLIITLAVCVSVLYAREKGDQAGVKMFLGATSLKLIVCMTVALIYSRTTHINAVTFILNFFYLYFLNTAFEVYSLLSNLRHQIRK
jgi:preprotein translocase subunit SecG